MIDLLVDGLACYRLTRVVATDAIGEPVRVRANRVDARLGELVSCPWCLSVWVAAALPVLPPRLRRAAATSAIAGLVAHAVGD